MNLSLQQLVDALLYMGWHEECQIVVDCMPPFPDSKTRPTVQVHHSSGARLRYSHGPRQEFFWDVYGDDMQSAALAIVALSKAPAPPRADKCWPRNERSPLDLVRFVVEMPKP